MTKQQKIRITIDTVMTILSFILMGGSWFFPLDIIHEILGIILFVLWAIHIVLNWRWYKSLLNGTYGAYRILQTVINCAITICVIFLIISGVMLSAHLFVFIKIEFGAYFARTVHLLASHWYFIFMSLHIGLHFGMIYDLLTSKNKIEKTQESQIADKKHPTIISIILKVILIFICIYGINAFILRGIWGYLILHKNFFFLDMSGGYLLFFIDYLSITVLFATVSYYLAQGLGEIKKISRAKI